MNNSCPNCCSHKIEKSKKKGVKKCLVCGTEFMVNGSDKKVITEGYDILL